MPHWKLLLLPLAVIVPLVAYLAGAVADGPDGPAQPEPVVLSESTDASGDDERRPGREPTGDPARENEGDDRGDDHGGDRDDDDRDDDDSDDRVRVVLPEPTEVDDDPEGDDDHDRDDTDDHGDDDGDDD